MDGMAESGAELGWTEATRSPASLLEDSRPPPGMVSSGAEVVSIACWPLKPAVPTFGFLPLGSVRVIPAAEVGTSGSSCCCGAAGAMLSCAAEEVLSSVAGQQEVFLAAGFLERAREEREEGAGALILVLEPPWAALKLGPGKPPLARVGVHLP